MSGPEESPTCCPHLDGDECESLIELRDALAKQRQWVKCSTTLPPPVRMILLRVWVKPKRGSTNPGQWRTVCGHLETFAHGSWPETYGTDIGHKVGGEVSHWMPLPAPPPAGNREG